MRENLRVYIMTLDAENLSVNAMVKQGVTQYWAALVQGWVGQIRLILALTLVSIHVFFLGGLAWLAYRDLRLKVSKTIR